jgi:hypothetical protein
MGYQPAMPTAFEQQLRALGLDERTCLTSEALRLWCKRNKDWCYIPEWLLARWGMSVDGDFSTERKARAA